MSAGNYTITICQGTDYKLLLTIVDENSSPIDITGYTFTGQFRAYVSSPDIVASFSFSVLNQVTNTGEVEVSLSNATSTAIVLPVQKTIDRTNVKFPYDIESNNGGVIQRWLQGVVELSPEVTR